MAGQQVIHMAPPADRVPTLMADLFGWLTATDAHPLITSSVFHYEFEFIHPFAGGNGRMGRLWQNLILARWNPLFADIPVESLIFEHQAECYQAIQESTRQTDSAPFTTTLPACARSAIPPPHECPRTSHRGMPIASRSARRSPASCSMRAACGPGGALLSPRPRWS